MRPIHLVSILLISLVLTQSAPADDQDTETIRFATFNIAMGLETEGEMHERLMSGDDEALMKVAAIIQQVRPDVLLLNEFDWYQLDSTLLFIRNYLDHSQYGNDPIDYPQALSGAVNTGEASGLDLDNNGVLNEPQDAWGYGKFPGQYGMVILSRYPLKLQRNFRHFKWKDMPEALIPENPDGSSYYSKEVYQQLRLSSKSHWDVALEIGEQTIHFLVSHPTPPVFDGPEDRNGKRNHDEIRLWANYIDPSQSAYIYDDSGITGGLPANTHFVIAGDLNADPVDGDSSDSAILQLLDHPMVNATCEPSSQGAKEASLTQGGKNLEQKGNPGADTGDFNDQYTGNMRIDYVLPSATLAVIDCGVYWPASDQPGHELTDVSDHHLVWVDISIPD
jgi:endonuclease/exonuclease/phosphatase family metal-dependent hydrolase